MIVLKEVATKMKLCDFIL